MRLSVIGCGYVGLVTGACFAEAGHEVVCTDVDRERIAKLNAGGIPIYEEHLDQILASAHKAGRISYTDDAGEAIRAGDAIFICVGTPPKDSGEADLSAIDNVARQIAAEAKSPKLVVEKSTVPARTGLELSRALAAYSKNSKVKFRVASNPEFLREGTAVEDFFHPDRIVVGVEDPSSAAELREIYRPILEKSFRCPVHNGTCPPGHKAEFLVTTINSAELIKHASNSFLALKISYANVIADLCEKIGANVEEVTHAMGLDARIGGQFLKAGLGYGGFCFPKDVQAFIHLSASVGVDFDILKATERVNKQRIDRYFEKIRQALWVWPSRPTRTTSASLRRWKSSSACSEKAPSCMRRIRKRCRAPRRSFRRCTITRMPTRLCKMPMPRWFARSGIPSENSIGTAPEKSWRANW